MKHKERSAFLIYHDDYSIAVRLLNEAQLGRLSKSLYLASIGHPVDESTLDDLVRALYMMMVIKIERDARRYEETCERQRRNIAKRYSKQEEQASSTSTTVYHGIPDLPKEKAIEKAIEEETEKAEVKAEVTVKEKETDRACAPDAPFVPPTPQEVEEYALSLGQTLDGNRFCDYHTAKGWMVGSTPMRNWRAMVRLWLQDDQQRAASPPQHKTKQVNAQKYTQRTYEEKDLAFHDHELMSIAEDRTRSGILT